MRVFSILAVAGALSVIQPVLAEAGPRHFFKDRIEDRIDRRENRRDEAVDHGRWDVLEDRIDRREDRCDRNNTCQTPFLNHWERHSWWRLLGNN